MYFFNVKKYKKVFRICRDVLMGANVSLGFGRQITKGLRKNFNDIIYELGRIPEEYINSLELCCKNK